MRAKDICKDQDLTPEEKWRKINGTDNFGNLPEYLVNNHTGHCWASCPYDSNATDMRTRNLLGISISGTLPNRSPHVDGNGRSYFMKTDNRGSWGYTCTFSGCLHLLDTGTRYFYK